MSQDQRPVVPLARAYVLLAVAPFLWAGNWVVARAVHSDIPASGLNFWRWSLALVILLPFCARAVVKEWPRIIENWKVLLALGVLGAGLFQFIVYQGLHYTSAINGVVLNATLAFFMILISRVLLGERISKRQAVGLGVCVLGILVIAGKGNPAALFTFDFGWGDLMVFFAMPLWALYTVILKRWPPPFDSWVLLTVLSAIGVAVMAPIHGADIILNGNAVVFSRENVLAILYVGIFPAVIAFYCWNEGVRGAGPNIAGFFYYLMPAYGTLLAVIFLGEQLCWFQIAGLALILVGVYFSTSTTRKHASNT